MVRRTRMTRASREECLSLLGSSETMRTQNVVTFLITLVAIPLLPIQIVCQLVLGLLVTLTFGLLLLPLSLIYILLFFGPLLGLSWLWLRAPLLRAPVALVGVPLAVIGSAYVALIPSMGEPESRITKLLLTDLWPYSLLYWKWDTGRLRWDTAQNIEFGLVLARERGRVAPHRAYIDAKVAAATPEPVLDAVTD